VPAPTVEELLFLLPPWATLAALVGVVQGALGYLALGRHLRAFPLYLAIGVGAAVLSQALAYALLPPAGPLALGEVHLPAVALGAWGALAVARRSGVC
jgi:hypothetical protein